MDTEKMREAYDHAKAAYYIIEQLAKDEPGPHGYASVGSALDKMKRKAHVLAGDTFRMSKDPNAGSQRVRG